MPESTPRPDPPRDRPQGQQVVPAVRHGQEARRLSPWTRPARMACTRSARSAGPSIASVEPSAEGGRGL